MEKQTYTREQQIDILSEVAKASGDICQEANDGLFKVGCKATSEVVIDALLKLFGVEEDHGKQLLIDTAAVMAEKIVADDAKEMPKDLREAVNKAVGTMAKDYIKEQLERS